jgi:hypothetical protein
LRPAVLTDWPGVLFVRVSIKSNVDRVVAKMGSGAREVAEQCVPRALNRVIDMARTQSARDMVADGYNVKVSAVKASVRVIRASRGQRTVRLVIPRQTKSLLEFNAKETKAGVTVKVHGARKLIKGAFIGQLQNGRLGVYIEDKTAGKTILRKAKQYKRGSSGGWQSYPVRKLYGPSLGGMFVNEKLLATLNRFVGEKLEERLRHEIKRAMG